MNVVYRVDLGSDCSTCNSDLGLHPRNFSKRMFLHVPAYRLDLGSECNYCESDLALHCLLKLYLPHVYQLTSFVIFVIIYELLILL